MIGDIEGGKDVSDSLPRDPIRPSITWLNGRKPEIYQ
jgi:hypothetical protein